MIYKRNYRNDMYLYPDQPEPLPDHKKLRGHFSRYGEVCYVDRMDNGMRAVIRFVMIEIHLFC